MPPDHADAGASPVAPADPGTQAESAYRLVARPDEITHFVCCRDVVWHTTFCGIRGLQDVNPAAEIICTMCVESAEAMLPGCTSSPETVCPVDKRRCPDEHEVDLRIARETDPGV